MKRISIRALGTSSFLLMATAGFAASGAEHGLLKLSERVGVDAGDLEQFYDSLKSPARQSGSAAACADVLATSRADFLRCLAERGREGLDEEFFARLYERRLALTPAGGVPNAESKRSLALLAWVLDLAREARHASGLNSNWFVRGQGFSNVRDYWDFPFEDGDVVLALGHSSISSLISQVSEPQGRYSHAFLVRVRDGKPATLESLIETGVREFDWKRFQQQGYNALTVLRWKDPATRARIARLASDSAFRSARARVPYDTAIDVNDPSKIFCAELVLHAYSEAAGLVYRQLLPFMSNVRSGAAFRYLRNIGVMNDRDIASPADFMYSPYFEAVADFRPADLLRSWQLYLMGDLFLERIEAGYRVRPDALTWAAPLGASLLQMLPSLLVDDWRILPKSLTPHGLSTVATVERQIYAPAYRAAEGHLPSRSLLDVSPWDLRDALEQALDADRRIGQVFNGQNVR